MKRILVPLIALLVIAFVVTGCGTSTPSATTNPVQTTSAPTTAAAATTTTAPTTTAATTIAPTTTSPAATTATSPTSTGEKPVYGGIFRIITAAGPQSLSYVPDMGPADAAAVFPAVERLLDISTNRTQGSGLEPVLADSATEDPDALTITFHIRKGIKFSDGSDLNAEVAKWNFQVLIDAQRLQYENALKSMEVTDPYTLVMHLNYWTNQLLPSWGWTAEYSEQAWNQASGGDLQKGREWARTNVVGTGPFTLQDFVPDDHMDWVRNPNYWQPGLPYLDGINVRFIPNTSTAADIMQAKQADQWSSPDPTSIDALQPKGFQILKSTWAGLIYSVLPNTATTDSKWNNLQLRQALAYAIDTDAVAKAIGHGLYTPLHYLPPQGQWGYIPNYPAITYNPTKAKQLLAQAGYPNGLQTSLLIPNDPLSQDVGTAIQQYLNAVGINTSLDVADPGRYYASIYGSSPYPELSFVLSGSTTDANWLLTYMRWFSFDPFTNLSQLGRPPEQVAMDKQMETIRDSAGQQAALQKTMQWFNDNVRQVPIYWVPGTAVLQPWVHTTEFTQGFARWQTELIWMDKH